jgi:glycosyltransferase involved in cell wall biosynthesis
MCPKISVITPFLDAESFLQDAITSVQNQTFSEWELLLVDDGSADKSPSIASLAAAKDDRIKVLQRPRELAGGAAAARNVALRAAAGEFIAFLDADDVYESRMLEVYLNALRARQDVAMVYGPTRWWNQENSGHDLIESMDRQAGRTHQPPRLLAWIIVLQMGVVPCTCGVLIRRSAIDAVGGFEERFQLYEDQALWAKLLLRFPAYVLTYCGARYRQHPGSTSVRATADGSYDQLGPHPARAKFLEWLREYVLKSGVRSWTLNGAIYLARAPYAGGSGIKFHLNRAAWLGFLLTTKLKRRLEHKFRVPVRYLRPRPHVRS